MTSDNKYNVNEPEFFEALEQRQTNQMKNHLHQKWIDSPEFKEARARFLNSPMGHNISANFEQSREYANGRYLFRKRINSGGDGNDG